MDKNKRFEMSILEMIEKDILGQSEEDVLKEHSASKIEETNEFLSTKPLISNALISHKKNKLKIARQSLNHIQATNVKSKKIDNAKEFIIGLISKGKLPDGLTLAFREGEEIPDEEIASIIEDLRFLGVDFDDE